MRIGIFSSSSDGTIDGYVAEARAAERDGFASYWVAQIFGPDALTVLGTVGREVPRIELGTSVVPTYPRHPMMLAQQALTANAMSGGRLCLGIGLSHKVVIEATSQKTGATGHYCIECNSWNLIEAVGTWAPGEEAPAAD